jgi:hypothetical protein
MKLTYRGVNKNHIVKVELGTGVLYRELEEDLIAGLQ